VQLQRHTWNEEVGGRRILLPNKEEKMTFCTTGHILESIAGFWGGRRVEKS